MSAYTGPSLGPPASSVRQPTFRILANGTVLPWPISASVTQNNFSQAATFDATVALTPNDQNGLAWFATTTDIKVQIDVALSPGASWTTLIYGLTDNVELDPIAGTATMTGRDLSALFLDTPTEQTYQNQTASQVAQSFVAFQNARIPGLNLTGNITATTAPVGRFYGVDYSMTFYGQLYRATNQWDLLLALAQFSGFEVYVTGKTLYFGPPTAATVPPFTLAFSGQPGAVVANVERLTMSRSLTLAKDVQVTVLSWNSMQMHPIKRVVKSTGAKAPPGGFGPVQNYVFVKPDLTPDQALQYGQEKLREITRHERVIEATMPGDVALTPQSTIRLVGTGTDFDSPSGGIYYPDTITREISFEEGYHQTVRAKNMSPASQAVIE